MGLKTISAKGLNLKGFGYKVFRLEDCKLYCNAQGNGLALGIGKWLDEVKFRKQRVFWYTRPPSCLIPCTYYNRFYKTGWHIFATRRGAKAYNSIPFAFKGVIRKVEYKRGHTVGRQDFNRNGVKVIVAKFIKIR
jgi:hypothetical protein